MTVFDPLTGQTAIIIDFAERRAFRQLAEEERARVEELKRRHEEKAASLAAAIAQHEDWEEWDPA